MIDGTGGHGGMIWGGQGFSGAGWDGRTISMPTIMTTEPVINLSVNGATSGPILVDTGSAGLVMQIKDIGGLPGLLKLGIPHGINLSAYSGGLTYLYATYPTTTHPPRRWATQRYRPPRHQSAVGPGVVA
ncbi:hypothetical protein A9W98_04265 [Mycobacterium gordonae]|uniref:PE cleavage protein A C-terminal domain-containing protein n=1 Tax=Mycobacterium gordonae TaxID=1778 RepID=A0A1A6B743_MYCGO|nr:hypothetical protein A9W98_04265 [Mycobacterium gordonae]